MCSLGAFDGNAATSAWVAGLASRAPALLSELFDSAADSVQFRSNTTQSFRAAVEGVDWARGGELLLSSEEYPTMIELALQAMPDWADLRSVPSRADLAEEVTARTQLVLVSQVAWRDGRCASLVDLASRCREVGALLVVDVAQSAGCLSLKPVIDCALALAWYRSLRRFQTVFEER